MLSVSLLSGNLVFLTTRKSETSLSDFAVSSTLRKSKVIFDKNVQSAVRSSARDDCFYENLLFCLITFFEIFTNGFSHNKLLLSKNAESFETQHFWLSEIWLFYPGPLAYSEHSSTRGCVINLSVLRRNLTQNWGKNLKCQTMSDWSQVQVQYEARRLRLHPLNFQNTPVSSAVQNSRCGTIQNKIFEKSLARL